MRRIYLFVAPPYRALLRETTDVSHFSRNPIRASNVWKSRCCCDFPQRFISPLARSLSALQRHAHYPGRGPRWNISISDWHSHQERVPDACSCGASLDELQPGEFWGGCTEVQMRENSRGADLAEPRHNFLRKCCRLFQPLVVRYIDI